MQSLSSRNEEWPYLLAKVALVCSVEENKDVELFIHHKLVEALAVEGQDEARGAICGGAFGSLVGQESPC